MKRCLVFLTLLFLQVSVASAQTYICTMRETGDGFVSEVVGLELDLANSRALVIDRFIAFVYEEPIPARVRLRNGGARIEVSWNLTIPANPRPARIRYRLTFDASSGAASLRGDIRHADNSVGGRGTCIEGTLPS